MSDGLCRFGDASARKREDRAAALAAVAILGLVVAPLLHAEEHHREAQQDEAEIAALVDAWDAASQDPADVLAAALRRVHRERPRPPAHHQHGAPSDGTSHGAGSLAHFAVSLASPPPPLTLSCPSTVLASPSAAPSGEVPARRWHTPEVAQGPPAA